MAETRDRIFEECWDCERQFTESDDEWPLCLFADQIDGWAAAMNDDAEASRGQRHDG